MPMGDHPRSRGVYGCCQSALVAAAGSSPLARGLHDGYQQAKRYARIIPARAGFTCPSRTAWSGLADHPRSRGVYIACAACWGTTPGSSPLARGLLELLPRAAHQDGIIPARAGFTPTGDDRADQLEDHPRSRGVYRTTGWAGASAGGSSPLARGLRGRRRRFGAPCRIIPARAGFTSHPAWCRRRTPDHPRSRGVYSPSWRPPFVHTGSSPLARGLPDRRRPRRRHRRIIPARAGFTCSRRTRCRSRPDHPRSRGVYTCGSLESQRRATLPDRVHLHCRPSARSAEFR